MGALRRKNLVTQKNIKKRFQFEMEMLRKDSCFCNRVLWSDEYKFYLFQTDGKTHVRRSPNKALDRWYTVKAVKYSGGCIIV